MPNSELKAEALELFNAKEYPKALELYLYIAGQGLSFAFYCGVFLS